MGNGKTIFGYFIHIPTVSKDDEEDQTLMDSFNLSHPIGQGGKRSRKHKKKTGRQERGREKDLEKKKRN